nr:hypothetical protein [Tanacetum cinerariifolium]
MTITQMVSKPCDDLKSLVTKSIVILSHFHMECFGYESGYEYCVPSTNKRTERENYPNSRGHATCLRDRLWKGLGLEFTIEKIVLIKQRIQAAQDRQKSYADLKHKPMEFEVRLELPRELSRVHHTFHVSNLKKCYADEPLAMPLEGVHIDDTLHFVEEPVEIMEREIKLLKRSQIPLVKVRWNSRRGPEFTWEREDSFKRKYPHLFTNRASSSTTRS